MTARGQFVFPICAGMALAVFSGGCAIGGKSFSIDSNSRIPFFGLELKERKPKSNAPSYNSISRSGSEASRVETALGTVSSRPIDLVAIADRRPGTAVFAGTVKSDRASQDTSSLSAGKSLPVPSIPLPLTDRVPESADRRSGPSFTDFQ